MLKKHVGQGSDLKRALRVARLFCLASTFAFGCCGSKLNSPCQQSGRSTATQGLKLGEPSKPVLEVRGGAYLEGLHPTLVERARLLYERAQAKGIKLRFISGYRRFRPKRNPKVGGSVASWHNFGAAFDVNLHQRKSMKDALQHLEEDEVTWRIVGEIAAELGLTWGKPWGDAEIFHFEWHPGHPDALRRPAFEKLIKASGENVDHYREAWKLFTNESQ